MEEPDNLNKKLSILRLIKLYRNHECLWNMNSPYYKRIDLKHRAWKEISKDFIGISVEKLKTKVKGIRGTYLAEKKRVEKSRKAESPSNVYQPMLFYYKYMKFLDGHIIQRKALEANSEIGSTSASVKNADITSDDLSHDKSFWKQEISHVNLEQDEADEKYLTNDFEEVTVDNVYENNLQLSPSFSTQPVTGANKCFKAEEAMIKMSECIVENLNRKAEKEKSSTPFFSPQLEQLAEMVKMDLSDVETEIFLDAKWKIIEILKEAQMKHYQKIKTTTCKFGTK